jgi:hypothetical protein
MTRSNRTTVRMDDRTCYIMTKGLLFRPSVTSKIAPDEIVEITHPAGSEMLKVLTADHRVSEIWVSHGVTKGVSNTNDIWIEDRRPGGYSEQDTDAVAGAGSKRKRSVA